MNRKIYRRETQSLLVALLLGALLVWSVSVIAWLMVEHGPSIPVVSFSNTTKQCVKVEPEGSCDALPRKYIFQWVK